MRLRNIKNAPLRLAQNERDFIVNPQEYKGKWHEVFGNNNPIHIEIGMGKGQFLTTLALKNPNINYIGIEKFSSVLLRASEKLEQIELNNVRIIIIFIIFFRFISFNFEFFVFVFRSFFKRFFRFFINVLFE